MMMTKKPIHILGSPFDLGCSIPGSRLGPDAIRIAEIEKSLIELGYKVHDHGNLSCTLNNEWSFEEKIEQTKIICEKIAQWSEKAHSQGDHAVLLGGDHSLAIGSIAGASSAYRKKQKKMGVIWFDAHADINTPETSSTKNIHGMPVSAVLGYGHTSLKNLIFEGQKVQPQNFVFIGLRLLDEPEKILCREYGVHAYSMEDIDQFGMAYVANEAMKKACDGTEGFHLSFDMDAADPSYAPGVSTPVLGGPTYREILNFLRMCFQSQKCLSMDIMELNPLEDKKNQTAKAAVDFVCCLFGRKFI